MRSSVFVLLLAVLCSPASRRADADTSVGKILAVVQDENADLAKPKSPNTPTLLNADDRVREILADPTTVEAVNRVIKRQIARVPLLAGLDLKLKTFAEADDDKGVGFEYSYEKGIEREIESVSRGNRSQYAQVDFTFSSRGNVAFDHPTNPTDFLDTNASLGGYWSRGGIREPFSDEERKRYKALSNEIMDIETEAELMASPKTRELLSLARGKLTNQFAVDLRGKGGIESTQDFSTRQWVYGGQLGIVLTGWEKFDARTWDATSRLAKFNMVDYPFAAVRWLTGFDEGFAPRGLSYPAARVGLALVDPEEGDPRSDVSDDSSFPRVDAEVSFRTPLFEITSVDDTLLGGPSSILSKLGVFYFSADYRYYREIGASEAVEGANLDEFGYTALTLGTTSGAFFTYANGKVPFDASDDSIFEVGYKFHF